MLGELTVVDDGRHPPTAAARDAPGRAAPCVVTRTDDGQWRPADTDVLAVHLDVRVDDLSWRSMDGTEIDGLLLTRADLDARRCPSVVAIHGGPANLWTTSARRQVPSRSLGRATRSSCPNPRGSVGRGQRFARANLGDPAGRELDDVLAAATMCRHEGLVLDQPPGDRRWFVRRLPRCRRERPAHGHRGRRGHVRAPRSDQCSLRQQQLEVLRRPARRPADRVRRSDSTSSGRRCSTPTPTCHRRSSCTVTATGARRSAR